MHEAGDMFTYNTAARSISPPPFFLIGSFVTVFAKGVFPDASLDLLFKLLDMS
jgi:hypothetical protein